MTDEQREMYEFLVALSQQVERGDIAGLAVGIISPAKIVRSAFLGACSREPIQTLGIARLMSRSVEDYMLSPEPPPNEPDQAPPPKPRKS